jgi:FkbM family methyltransferase
VSAIGLIRFIISHPLNQGGKIAAILRFARWQIASRLIRRPIALPFVGETQLLVETGMSGTTGNWYCGLQESSEMGFVLHALRSRDLFVDVGANIGSFTVLAAGACGADVISIEPVLRTYDRLCANVRLNALDSVQTLQIGLSSKPGELHFTTELGTQNRVATPEDQGLSLPVKVTTLDLLCRMRAPTVIKIDVEGHEFAILEGGGSVLNSPDVMAVLLENGLGQALGVSDADVHARMRGYGFMPRTYDPISRSLLEPTSLSGNTIFVRDEIEILAKLRAAPNYRLVNRII